MRVVFQVNSRDSEHFFLGQVIKESKMGVTVQSDSGKNYLIKPTNILGETLAGHRPAPFRTKEAALRYVNTTKPAHAVPKINTLVWDVGDRILCVCEGTQLGTVEKVSTAHLVILLDNGKMVTLPSVGTHILGRGTSKRQKGFIKNPDKYIVKADADLSDSIPVVEEELKLNFADTIWLGNSFIGKNPTQCQTDKGPVWLYSVYDAGQLLDYPDDFQDAFIGTLGVKERFGQITGIVSISMQAEKVEEYAVPFFQVLKRYKTDQPIALPHILVPALESLGGRLVDEAGNGFVTPPNELRKIYFTFNPAPPKPEVTIVPPVEEISPVKKPVGKGGRKKSNKNPVSKMPLPNLPVTE